MIIHDGNFRRTGVCPAEGNAPLVVDADRVEAGQIALERLQPVTGRDGHILQTPGSVELNELPQGDARDGREAAVLLGTKKLLGVGVGEGLDHREIIAQSAFVIIAPRKSPGEVRRGFRVRDLTGRLRIRRRCASLRCCRRFFRRRCRFSFRARSSQATTLRRRWRRGRRRRLRRGLLSWSLHSPSRCRRRRGTGGSRSSLSRSARRGGTCDSWSSCRQSPARG